MESRKRKREPELEYDLPRITYHVRQSNRVFERLFKENSREELCNIVRKKLNLDPTIPLELHQVRDGIVYDLEDDDDFNAFKAATYVYDSIDIHVKYSTPVASPRISIPHDTLQHETLPVKKKMTSKKRVSAASVPDSDGNEQAQNLSPSPNQVADAYAQSELSERPRKKRKKDSDISIPSASRTKRKSSNAADSGSSSALATTEPPPKKPKSTVRDTNAESLPIPVAKPRSTKGKAKESVKEKDSETGTTKEKEKVESGTTKEKKLRTTVTSEKTSSAKNVQKDKAMIGKSPAEASSSLAKSPFAAADSYKGDDTVVVKAKHTSSTKPSSKRKQKKAEEKEEDNAHFPSPSNEVEQSIKEPKRKKKDTVESPTSVSESEEAPKKKKKGKRSKKEKEKDKDIAEKENAEKLPRNKNELTVTAVSSPSTKDTAVPSIANKATKSSGKSSITLKKLSETSSSAHTIVPLSTPSVPPSLSALTGSNQKSVQEPGSGQQLCPLCHERFHFRFKCPVIINGIESIEKKKAELRAKGGQEALISELEVWIQKKKPLGSSVVMSSTSIVPAASAASTLNQGGSHTPSVFPVKSVRSKVTVESHDEGSESDGSTSDGEDNATRTGSSSESSRPSASPSVNLEDVDLNALVRGPVMKSLAKAFSKLEEEERECISEGTSDGEEEGLLEEDEKEEKIMQKRLKVLRFKRASSSEYVMDEDEGEDIEFFPVDNDKSKSNEVSTIFPGQRMTLPSHEKSTEIAGRDANNDEAERIEMRCTSVAEETLEGRRVTDEMTPATEGITVEIPGDNADPSKPLKSDDFAADLAAEESGTKEKNLLAKPRREKNMNDVTSVNSISSAIAPITDVVGESTPPATSSTRSSSPTPHSQSRRISPSPVRPPVSKTYARSPAVRRMKDKRGNPRVYETDKAEQPIENNVMTPSPTIPRAPTAVDISGSPSPVASRDGLSEKPKRGRPPGSTSKRAQSVPTSPSLPEVPSVSSASQPTPKKRGRPPLSEAVKAERQARRDAKAADKKAKAEAKKALTEVRKRAKKANSQPIEKQPSESTEPAEPLTRTENPPSRETEPNVSTSPNISLVENSSKLGDDTSHSLGPPSFSLAKSPPVGSQWKALPPPSETEPSPSSPHIDQLISSQATPKMNELLHSVRSRSVSHAVDEADVEEIIGTTKDYEGSGEERQPEPLFLPGASQPTQVFPGPFFSALLDSEAKGAEEGTKDGESENTSERGKQYQDSSPSATPSHTEASSDEEPTSPLPPTIAVSIPKPVIKAPFPSLSQLTSSMQHLTRAPSFLMPARFAKMGQSQSQSQKDGTFGRTSQVNSGESSENDDDDSSEEERVSHIPKERRAGASMIKKKRKGLLQD